MNILHVSSKHIDSKKENTCFFLIHCNAIISLLHVRDIFLMFMQKLETLISTYNTGLDVNMVYLHSDLYEKWHCKTKQTHFAFFHIHKMFLRHLVHMQSSLKTNPAYHCLTPWPLDEVSLIFH